MDTAEGINVLSKRTRIIEVTSDKRAATLVSIIASINNCQIASFSVSIIHLLLEAEAN